MAINRATVMLPRNLSQRPSYGEAFFQTMVHELGHAVGLQHSLTSGAMATEITRATSRSKPLGGDDIAGLAALYPVRTAPVVNGSISGRITMGSDAVALASVVALPANGHAISALTNPDGSYRIDNVPPGSMRSTCIPCQRQCRVRLPRRTSFSPFGQTAVRSQPGQPLKHNSFRVAERRFLTLP